MAQLCRKTWTRALLLVLFFVGTAVAAIAKPIYSFALEDGWYGGEDFTFTDSWLCRSYVNDSLYHVKMNVEWLEDPYDNSLGGYGGSAFAYVVSDLQTGDILADTRTERSRFVVDYASTVNIDGMPKYRLAGYVNLPVEPYEGCYAEYYIFEHLYPLHRMFLPAVALGAAIAAASFALSVWMAAAAGRQGIATLLGRVPLDLAALVLLLTALYASALWDTFLSIWILPYGGGDHITVFQRVFQTSDLWKVFVIWVAALALCCLANQLADHTFQNRLLLRKLSQAWLLPLVLLLHGLGLALCVVFHYQQFSKRMLTCFIFLDVALIPVVVQWTAEGRRVREAANSLAAGDLTCQVEEERLHFAPWQKLGRHLNRIGEGMAAAVEERMRNERMKTELITNVSHDLKTPLTSIINYIDLLQDPVLSEETRREYVQILERQSAKLKKLTDDVVEASKAASGAVKVHAEIFDVTELLAQAVGEHGGQLQDAGIEPVFHTSEREVYIHADARLLGRVLDNLITNIIKYAQPGTRAYFDLDTGPDTTVITVKNTSRAALDIPAEELMERFVRGDSSRGSEGSGLGLSIARSLTELTGGQFSLLLDGDLFKAVVTFPTAGPPDTPCGQLSVSA